MIIIFVIPNVELVIFNKASHLYDFQAKLLIVQYNNVNGNYSFLITTCHAPDFINALLILTVYILCENANQNEMKNIIEGPNLKMIKQMLFEKEYSTTSKE